MTLLPEQQAILDKYEVRSGPPPTIHDALSAVPGLRAVDLKLFNPRFFDVGLRVRTLPDPLDPDVFVFGYYVVDRECVRGHAPLGQIKQDFLLWNSRTNEACYYTGYPKQRHPLKRDIRHFCSDLKLSDRAYGCESDESGRLRPSDHYYADENDVRLQEPPVHRELFAFAMSRVREELRNKAVSQ